MNYTFKVSNSSTEDKPQYWTLKNVDKHLHVSKHPSTANDLLPLSLSHTNTPPRHIHTHSFPRTDTGHAGHQPPLPRGWGFPSMHTLPVGAEGALEGHLADGYAAEKAPSQAHAHTCEVWSLHCHPECCIPRCHPTRQSAAAHAVPLQGGQIFVLCLYLLQAISFFVSKVVLKLNLTEEMRIYFRKRYLGSLIYFNRKLKWLG